MSDFRYFGTAAKGDDPHEAIAQLHKAYLASIRQHSALVGDLCATLQKLEAALSSADIDPAQRLALTQGIVRHVDAAKAIVSRIDGTLMSAGAPQAIGLH